MTSIRQLKFAAGCGEPDSVPSRQLDVVIAAEALYDAQIAGDYVAMDKQEGRLEQAIRRLRNARRARSKQQAGCR